MVKIVTDATAGLPRDVAERYGIPVIPQVVSFGNDSYLEGIELDNAGFMARLRSSRELPKTAAPPVRLFVEAFERLVPSGEPIICIHPSALVSGTVRSATVAAAEFPSADIRVVDTRTVASPMASMVELAARWAEEGSDADTIVARIEDMSRRCRIYFLVATLEYLAKGGRIGGAADLCTRHSLGSIPILDVPPAIVTHGGPGILGVGFFAAGDAAAIAGAVAGEGASARS